MEKKSKIFEMYDGMSEEEKNGMNKFMDLIIDDLAEKDIEIKACKFYKDLGDSASDSLKCVRKTEDEKEKQERAEKLCIIFEQCINTLKDFQKGN